MKLRGHLLLMGLCAAGCYPIQVSEACRRQMDQCLQRCEPDDLAVPAGGDWCPTDVRSKCVELCQDICT